MNTKTLVQFTLAFALAFASSAVASAADPDHAAHASGLGKPLPPGWEPAVHDRTIHTMTLFEKAEFRTGEAADAAVFDAQGWIGGDYRRFWWKAEGEQETEDAKSGEVEVQALYSRLIGAFWDLQTGVRVDRQYRSPSRDTTAYFVVGLEGLAPYWFEVEPTLFVSEKGKASFELTTSYDQLITQRLVIQPRLDLSAALQDDTKKNLGAGFNDVELSLRLRYDFSRQFSPYVGVTWRRALGETAAIRRQAGEKVSEAAMVFGLRTWF